MIFITVLMTVTCCETAALVIQVIIWGIYLIKSGSSNFCKDLPLFHPVTIIVSNFNIKVNSPTILSHKNGGYLLICSHWVKVSFFLAQPQIRRKDIHVNTSVLSSYEEWLYYLKTTMDFDFFQP